MKQKSQISPLSLTKSEEPKRIKQKFVPTPRSRYLGQIVSVSFDPGRYFYAKVMLFDNFNTDCKLGLWITDNTREPYVSNKMASLLAACGMDPYKEFYVSNLRDRYVGVNIVPDTRTDHTPDIGSFSKVDLIEEDII